eukprot:TRINITY_DN65533_c0_g3_i1.p2 TRINITY_DN65533_c0_g3~~TRINITY_DN65533_c0_g3_i1.p2  ORF type:complete len:329 (-),score=23.27 TRINITY_DN65533_c0_g3_i1:1020-2006(-)
MSTAGILRYTKEELLEYNSPPKRELKQKLNEMMYSREPFPKVHNVVGYLCLRRKPRDRNLVLSVLNTAEQYGDLASGFLLVADCLPAPAPEPACTENTDVESDVEEHPVLPKRQRKKRYPEVQKPIDMGELEKELGMAVTMVAWAERAVEGARAQFDFRHLRGQCHPSIQEHMAEIDAAMVAIELYLSGHMERLQQRHWQVNPAMDLVSPKFSAVGYPGSARLISAVCTGQWANGKGQLDLVGKLSHVRKTLTVCHTLMYHTQVMYKWLWPLRGNPQGRFPQAEKGFHPTQLILEIDALNLSVDQYKWDFDIAKLKDSSCLECRLTHC